MSAKDWRWQSKTGNKWLDEAWFAVTAKDASVYEQAVKLEQLYELKDALQKSLQTERWNKERFTESLTALKQARLRLEQENTKYVWAFPRLHDVLALLRLRKEARYRHYPKPKTIIEAQYTNLYTLFPYNAKTQLDVLIFDGKELCEDFRFGPDQRPHIWEVAKFAEQAFQETSDWWRYPHYGFRWGLFLVEVAAEALIYRLGEGQAAQIQSEAIALMRPNKPDRKLGFSLPTMNLDKDMNLNIEAILPRTFKRLFRVEPGQPLPKSNE